MIAWPKRWTPIKSLVNGDKRCEGYNQAHIECSKAAIDMLEKLKESQLYCSCCEEILFQITVIIEEIRGKMKV